MRPRGVHHVAIKVRDLAACERFYSEQLGLEVIRRQPHSVWLDAGGVILMLELGRAGDGEGGLHLLALRIARAERSAWAARLPVESQTAFTLYVRDPEGNRIGLSHYPDASD